MKSNPKNHKSLDVFSLVPWVFAAVLLYSGRAEGNWSSFAGSAAISAVCIFITYSAARLYKLYLFRKTAKELNADWSAYKASNELPKEEEQRFTTHLVKNRLRLLLSWTLNLGIQPAVIEELLFRMPLLVITLPNQLLQIYVVTCSIAFGAIHFFNADHILSAAEDSEESEISKKLQETLTRYKTVARVLYITMTGVIGYSFSILTLKYQSIWPAIIAHFAFNWIVTKLLLVAVLGLILLGIPFALYWLMNRAYAYYAGR